MQRKPVKFGYSPRYCNCRMPVHDTPFNRFLIRSNRLRNRYDLIINASSAGMTKKNKINRNILKLVKKAKGVIDIVYNPIETDLLKKAKKHDIKYSGGLKMLVEQAKPSYEISVSYTHLTLPTILLV